MAPVSSVLMYCSPILKESEIKTTTTHRWKIFSINKCPRRVNRVSLIETLTFKFVLFIVWLNNDGMLYYDNNELNIRDR